nr:reverse transcriptase domain-containing protein [Tanacetum cinerariifolium]
MAAERPGDLPVADLRTIEELCQPSFKGWGGPIAPIVIQATKFGLKNDMIQQVQNSCQFHGLPDVALELGKSISLSKLKKQKQQGRSSRGVAIQDTLSALKPKPATLKSKLKAIINKSLSRKTTNNDRLYISSINIMWGVFYRENVNYPVLIWEDCAYQNDHMKERKSRRENIPYPRFTKIIINHFLKQHKSLFNLKYQHYHTIKDDGINLSKDFNINSALLVGQKEFIRICALDLLDRIPELQHKKFRNICRDVKCLEARRVLDHINHDLKCLFLLWQSGFESQIGRANLDSINRWNSFFIMSSNLLCFLKIHNSV